MRNNAKTRVEQITLDERDVRSFGGCSQDTRDGWETG